MKRQISVVLVTVFSFVNRIILSLIICATFAFSGCESLGGTWQVNIPLTVTSGGRTRTFQLGNYADEQKKSRQESLREIDYRSSQGNLVRIEETTNEPLRITPGEMVKLRTSYYVMSPAPEAEIKIVETRIIQYNAQNVVDPLVREVRKRQGLAISTAKLSIPKDAIKGEYIVITTIDNGTMQDKRVSTFYIQ